MIRCGTYSVIVNDKSLVASLNRELDLFCGGTQTFLPPCHRGQTAPPPGGVVFFLVIFPALIVSVLQCFTLCHTARVFEFTGWRRRVVICTNTSAPFTTLVKLSSLRGSFVPCRTLQPCCPCFTGYYSVSYSVNLGSYTGWRRLVLCPHKQVSPLTILV